MSLVNVEQRILSFATPTDVVCYALGSLCAIGSAVAAPLVAVVSGGFITAFTDRSAGRLSASEFQDKLNTFV